MFSLRLLPRSSGLCAFQLLEHLSSSFYHVAWHCYGCQIAIFKNSRIRFRISARDFDCSDCTAGAPQLASTIGRALAARPLLRANASLLSTAASSIRVPTKPLNSGVAKWGKRALMAILG
jgi:hypothetical protein